MLSARSVRTVRCATMRLGECSSSRYTKRVMIGTSFQSRAGASVTRGVAYVSHIAQALPKSLPGLRRSPVYHHGELRQPFPFVTSRKDTVNAPVVLKKAINQPDDERAGEPQDDEDEDRSFSATKTFQN